jgi:V8-like Glu-specific endopeptidase
MRPLTRLAATVTALAAALALTAVTAGWSRTARTATKPRAVATVGPDAVGVLFGVTAAGRLSGNHFCTASVVHSPKGNVVVTAAHCLAGQTAGTLAFVPGYRQGKAPLGIWIVRKIYVDRAWMTSADPDHDYAFLVVERRGSSRSLESLTGAERLGDPVSATGKRAVVVGYPSARDSAIACRNLVREFRATQIEFDCDGYTNGTSGSAIVVDPDPATGLGTVVGVIGGFEQGGTTPSVSYAARFGRTARVLYARAMAG